MECNGATRGQNNFWTPQALQAFIRLACFHIFSRCIGSFWYSRILLMLINVYRNLHKLWEASVWQIITFFWKIQYTPHPCSLSCLKQSHDWMWSVCGVPACCTCMKDFMLEIGSFPFCVYVKVQNMPISRNGDHFTSWYSPHFEVDIVLSFSITSENW